MQLNGSTWRFYVAFPEAMPVSLLSAALIGVLAAIVVQAL